jgi:hypothetical protein
MRLCILLFLLTLVVESAAQMQDPGQLRVPKAKNWTEQNPKLKFQQAPESMPLPGWSPTDKKLDAHAEVIKLLSKRIDELEKRLGEIESRVGRK